MENNNAICNTGQRTKICFVWFVFYPWKLVLQDYNSRYEQRMRRFSIYWDCLLPSWLPAPICFPLHSTTTFLLAPICHHKYIDIPHLCFVVWKADVSKKNYEKKITYHMKPWNISLRQEFTIDFIETKYYIIIKIFLQWNKKNGEQTFFWRGMAFEEKLMTLGIQI